MGGVFNLFYSSFKHSVADGIEWTIWIAPAAVVLTVVLALWENYREERDAK
jgi:hypothetical protein